MLLLDTCTLVWLDSDPALLSATARQEIGNQARSLFVSSVSALELAIKIRKGKLTLPMPLETWFPGVLAAHGIEEMVVDWRDWRVSAATGALPLLHSDPFDRIIIATAKLNNQSIVTPDQLIRAYSDVPVVW